jgi:drug/metabolite transporter (DMT)-like permease
MIFLVLAILGSGVIPVVFRAFEGWRINVFWAIPANYVTCVLVGSLLIGEALNPAVLMSQPWVLFAALQGVILAVNFYLLACTAQRVSVAIASLASRLSVAIPSILAFVLYDESLTIAKISGLLAALLALYLCTAPDQHSGTRNPHLFHVLPIMLFLTFGTYFTILKYLQTYYLTESSYHSYVMSGFVFAFLSSIVIGIAKGVFASSDFRLRHSIAGIILGVINYIAIYALLKVLALEGWESSQLFPIYSVGVVAVSSLLALLFFKERLSRMKTIGLVVGLAAVALLNRS